MGLCESAVEPAEVAEQSLGHFAVAVAAPAADDRPHQLPHSHPLRRLRQRRLSTPAES